MDTHQLELNFYMETFPLKRCWLSVIEVPSHILSMCDIALTQKPSISLAQSILQGSLEAIGNIKLFEGAKVESLIGSGYESYTYSFLTPLGDRWVMKIGTKRGVTAGSPSPNSRKYYEIMAWNYTILESYFLDLPHFIPFKYLLVPPDQNPSGSTIQIMPYVDEVADLKLLSESQVQDLILERRQIFEISKKLQRQYKLLPEMINKKNILISWINGDPHFVLIDFGLNHLRLPNPVYNRANRIAQVIRLKEDLSHLRKTLRRTHKHIRLNPLI